MSGPLNVHVHMHSTCSQLMYCPPPPFPPATGDKLKLLWLTNDGTEHKGQLDLNWLRNHDYSEATLNALQQSSRPNTTVCLFCTSVVLMESKVKWPSLLIRKGFPIETPNPALLCLWVAHVLTMITKSHVVPAGQPPSSALQ